MYNEIKVPIIGDNLHFGEISNYKQFKNKWFEQTEFDDDNLMYKAIIIDIKYFPDEYYYKNDGYCGTCWVAEIVVLSEGTFNKYYFRNFIDLIELFNEKGYKFIND